MFFIKLLCAKRLSAFEELPDTPTPIDNLAVGEETFGVNVDVIEMAEDVPDVAMDDDEEAVEGEVEPMAVESMDGEQTGGVAGDGGDSSNVPSASMMEVDDETTSGTNNSRRAAAAANEPPPAPIFRDPNAFVII